VRIDRTGDTSQRYRVRFERPARRELLLKRYPPERGAVDVEHELEGMRIARRALGGEGACRVPLAYACSAEHRALFSEFCPSVPLNKLMFGWLRISRLPATSGARARLIESAAAAGELLRLLHGAAVGESAGSALPTHEQVAERYDRRLQRLLERWNASGLSRSLGQRVGDYAAARLGTARSGYAPLVFQHSDFGSWNLLFRPGVLYVTDFHTWTLGHHEYDLLWFATALECLARYRVVDPGLLGEARSAFLRRAGRRAETEADQARFQGLRALHMVHFGRELREAREPLHELVYLPRARRRFVEGWLEDRLDDPPGDAG
jgi:aminoglycoside phosphotransferase (APT) family kinase protein